MAAKSVSATSGNARPSPKPIGANASTSAAQFGQASIRSRKTLSSDSSQYLDLKSNGVESLPPSRAYQKRASPGSPERHRARRFRVLSSRYIPARRASPHRLHRPRVNVARPHSGHLSTASATLLPAPANRSSPAL